MQADTYDSCGVSGLGAWYLTAMLLVALLSPLRLMFVGVDIAAVTDRANHRHETISFQ